MGKLAQDREPCPHILAALVVVCRGREHGVRKLNGPRLHPMVEISHRAGELSDIEAHVIARDQAPVTIKGGILHGLGAERRAQLLKADERDILQSVERRIGPLTG